MLRLEKITKTYPGVRALTDVDLCLNPGEVVGLCGENGAGKSTLTKIIGGITAPDSGTIEFDRKKLQEHSVARAQKLGVAIIHQELNLCPHLSAEANLFLGREPRRFGFIRRRALSRECGIALDRVGLPATLASLPVRQLSIAQRQLLEIARALSLNARLIVMDEPTSALSARETKHLLDLVRSLKSQGIAILYISHKLDEVLEIYDRVTVLRDGKNVGDLPTNERNRATLERMMVGRNIQMFARKTDRELGQPILEVNNLSSLALSSPISFSVRAGEILGFAGLVGSGRTELMRAIFGADPVRASRHGTDSHSFEILIAGNSAQIRSPRDAIMAGIGFVPEDRKEQGLILQMAVGPNISLAGISARSPLGWLNRRWENSTALEFIERLRIKTPSIRQRAVNLSGGNQQKIVLAKWLALEPKILILDEPTRGVDVGAKAEIHALIAEMAAKGMAILLVSSEMEEVIGLADRVIVMNQGRIAGELSGNEITEEKIMSLAAHRAAI